MGTNTSSRHSSAVRRRRLAFTSLEDVLGEAEHLSAAEVRTVGNWSLGQILDHLATWMEFSIDGVPARVPWALRAFARPLRSWLIHWPMPSGFRWPADADPRLVPHEPIATADGVDHLRRAVARLRSEPHRSPSPLLGELTAEQWEQVHLRHAELHLGYVVPVESE